jgi:hypothetical protein
MDMIDCGVMKVRKMLDDLSACPQIKARDQKGGIIISFRILFCAATFSILRKRTMKTILAILALTLTAHSGISFAESQPPAVADASATIQQQPFEGEVLDMMDAGGYTYIQLTSDKGPIWIAAPRIKLMKGNRLQHSGGAEMIDFHSKTLDRTFESITFVGKAWVVKK